MIPKLLFYRRATARPTDERRSGWGANRYPTGIIGWWVATPGWCLSFQFRHPPKPSKDRSAP